MKAWPPARPPLLDGGGRPGDADPRRREGPAQESTGAAGRFHSEERREELDEEELAPLIQERLKAQERGHDPYEVLKWLEERSGVLVERLLVGAGRRSDFVGLFERALRRSDLTNPEVAKLLGECI